VRRTLPVIEASSLAAALEQGTDAPARAVLEREALPAFVRGQRWFSAKARAVDQVRVVAYGPIPRVAPVTSDGAARWLLLADVVFAEGPGDRYVLPVAELPAKAATGLLARAPGAGIARLDNAGTRLLVDGMLDDELCRALLALIQASGRVPLSTGALVGADAPGLAPHELPPAAQRVRRTGAEQSNSSVIFGTSAIFKLFRRIEPGPHPEIEIGRHLMQAGFGAAPAIHGTLEYEAPDCQPAAVGVLHALVVNEGDGWAHALREVEAYFGRLEAHLRASADERTAPPNEDVLHDLAGSYVIAAATLGRQTAELHLALAQSFGNPEFEPEPLEAADAARVAEDTRARASRALAQLAGRVPELPSSAAARAQALIAAQPQLFERLDALAAGQIDGARTRVHQDYHLGQTLWTGRDYVILDFEGEPLRALADRRVKRSPLTDVAGMLRSYSYAGWTGLFTWCRRRGFDALAESAWALRWEGAVSGAFLQAYRGAAAGAPFVPHDDRQFDAWLGALMLEKGVYELEYELNNRPGWLLVPIEGLLRLL
jgi:trehalose synthase-fused probable maltokinase